MRFLLLAATAAVLVLAGCGSTTKTTTTHTVVTSPPTTPTSSADKWVGSWRTTFGQMEITAEGGTVSGTYDYCDGKLGGDIEGDTFSGNWQEAPEAPGCRRGQDLPHGGTFQFTLNPDGKSFSGTWKYDNGSVDKKQPDWNGVRVSP